MTKTKLSTKILALLAVALIASASLFVLFVPDTASAATYMWSFNGVAPSADTLGLDAYVDYRYSYTHSDNFYLLTQYNGTNWYFKQFGMTVRVTATSCFIVSLYFRDGSSIYGSSMDYYYIIRDSNVVVTSDISSTPIWYLEIDSSYEDVVQTVFYQSNDHVKLERDVASYNSNVRTVNLSDGSIFTNYFQVSDNYTYQYQLEYVGTCGTNTSITGSVHNYSVCFFDKGHKVYLIQNNVVQSPYTKGNPTYAMTSTAPSWFSALFSPVKSDDPTPEVPTDSDIQIISSDLGLTNGAGLSTLSYGGLTLSFSRGEGSANPAYYESGNAIRLYFGNTLTISGTSNISKIVFTLSDGGNSNSITSNVGNVSDFTWTGSSTFVTFTVGKTSTGSSSGHIRIARIDVYIVSSGGNTGGSSTPTTPPLLGANGTVDLSNTKWLLNESLTFNGVSDGNSITLYATLTLNELPPITYTVGGQTVTWTGTSIGSGSSYKDVTDIWYISTQKTFTSGYSTGYYIYANSIVHNLPGYVADNKPYQLYVYAYDSTATVPFNCNRILTFTNDSTLSTVDARTYSWLLANASFISGNLSYEQGLNAGYDSGYADGSARAQSVVNKGSASYTAGYNAGYTAGVGSASDYSFFGLIAAVIDVPLNAFMSLFNFDFLGINLAGFFASLLAISVILIVVKYVL